MWGSDLVPQRGDRYIFAPVIWTPRMRTADPHRPRFHDYGTFTPPPPGARVSPPMSCKNTRKRSPSSTVTVTFVAAFTHPRFNRSVHSRERNAAESSRPATYWTLGYERSPAELELQLQCSSESFVVQLACFATFPTVVQCRSFVSGQGCFRGPRFPFSRRRRCHCD